MPIKVPAHALLYQFHCAPVPRLPPETLSVTLLPTTTDEEELTAAVGAVLDC